MRRGQHERPAAAVAEPAERARASAPSPPARRGRPPTNSHQRVRLAASSGRSERPLPRGSNVTTRKWRERYGICAFQRRECEIGHGREEQERRRRVAVDLVEDAHAVALDEALLVGVAGAGLLAVAATTVTRASARSRAEEVEEDGIPRVWRVPAAFEQDELAARVLGERAPRVCGAIASSIAVDARAPGSARAARASRASSGSGFAPYCAAISVSGARLEPPADAVLDLLRRVRLPEHLREEELDEAAVVAQPVVPVVLRPALVRVELVLPRHRPAPASGSPPPE